MNGDTAIRYDVFNRMARYLGISKPEIKNNLKELKGNGGHPIRNPNLPFNFGTKYGARFLAAILGDGSFNSKGLFYSNSKHDLIKRFIQDCRKLFGDTKVHVRRKTEKSDVLLVQLPRICDKIVSLAGIKPGHRITTNPEIPSFIFDLGEKEIYEFLTQIIDDEGSVSVASRHIRIKLCTQAEEDECKLIRDIQKLLSKVDIDSEVYQIGEYESRTGDKRKNWQVEIHNHSQLKQLYSNLSLKHKSRKDKLKNLLDLHQRDTYPKKRCRQIYLSKMEEVQGRKGYFTSEDLAEELDRSQGHVRNQLRKYRQREVIQKTRDVVSNGRRSFPARYRVKE